MAVCLSYMEWRTGTETVRPVEWRMENGDAGGCFDEHWRLVWAVGSLRFSFAVYEFAVLTETTKGMGYQVGLQVAEWPKGL